MLKLALLLTFCCLLQPKLGWPTCCPSAAASHPVERHMRRMVHKDNPLGTNDRDQNLLIVTC